MKTARILPRRTVLVATAAFAAAGRRALAQSPTLHVIGPPNDGFKAVYYGIKAGVFRKNGLNVEATIINSGAAAAAALIGGGADVAYTNITTLISAHNKGVAMQILAPGALLNARTNNTQALLVLKDAPVRTGADLNGKTVGSVALGDSMAASIQAWIDQTGGDAKSVKLVEVPASAVVQMLETGRVSAAALNEPAVSQAVAGGKVRVLSYPLEAIATNFLAALFAVMAPAADKSAGAMRAFAVSMHESAAYTNTHLAETVPIVAEYSNTAPELVARSVRIVDAEYADAALIQPMIDVLVKYGITDRTFPASDLISPYALRRR